MATSTAQAIATVPVYDYYLPPGDPTKTNPVPAVGKVVKVTIQYGQASSASPVTAMSADPVYVKTDNNGFWQVNLVPTDQMNPSGVTYMVEVDGRPGYLINPIAAGAPGIGWQSSAIIVDPPPGIGVFGPTLPGGTVVNGTLQVNGKLTAEAIFESIMDIDADASVRIQGPDPWFDATHPAYGALGNDVADDSVAINACITAAYNYYISTGFNNRVTVVLPTPPKRYGIQNQIVLKPFIRYLFMGSVIAWKAAAPAGNTYMLDTGDPGAGFNNSHLDLYDFYLDGRSVNNVSGLRLVSWQKSLLDNGRIIGVNSGEGLRIDALSGNSATNNSALNRIRALKISSVNKGIVLSANNVGTGPFTTDHSWSQIYMDDVITTGISFVQWCDTHYWHGVGVSMRASAGSTQAVVFNDSGTPASNVGIYDEHFYGIFTDFFNSTGTQYPFIFNTSAEITIKGWFFSGTITAPLNDSGATSTNYYFEDCTTNGQITIRSRGVVHNWVNSGNNIASLVLGGGSGDSPPTHKGYVRMLVAGGDMAADGGLEFENSTFGSGSGWRIGTPDYGGGNTPYIFMARANSATWSEVARYDIQSGNLEFPTLHGVDTNGAGTLVLGTVSATGIRLGAATTQVGLGVAPSTAAGLLLQPTVSTAAGSGNIVLLQGTVTATANNDSLRGLTFSSALTFAKSTFTGLLAIGTLINGAAFVQSGTGTIATAYGLQVTTPTIGTGNYGINVSGASATTFVSGPGGTNYTLQVDSSAASAATGLKVTAAAAGSGLSLTVISSGTPENLTIDAKGAGTMTLQGTATGNLTLGSTSNLVNFGQNTTALGGGAAATLGTIGGSGPATAAQNSWLKVNINGTASFIPIWR